MGQEPTQNIQFELIRTHVIGGAILSTLRKVGDAGCCFGDVAAEDNGVEDVEEDCPLLESRVKPAGDDKGATASFLATEVSAGRLRVNDPPLGQVNLDLGFRV
jgi:hypothetical protein